MDSWKPGHDFISIYLKLAVNLPKIDFGVLKQVDVLFHGIEARPEIGNVLDGSAGNMKLLLRYRRALLSLSQKLPIYNSRMQHETAASFRTVNPA